MQEAQAAQNRRLSWSVLATPRKILSSPSATPDYQSHLTPFSASHGFPSENGDISAGGDLEQLLRACLAREQVNMATRQRLKKKYDWLKAKLNKLDQREIVSVYHSGCVVPYFLSV